MSEPLGRRSLLIACVLVGAAASACPAASHAAPIKIVAAENVYADVAAQVGGDDVTASGIISTPAQDPHQFEASPATTLALAGADIVIENGVDYDPWVDRLLASTSAPHRETIVVADLLHRKPGDNPHLWYDPKCMLVLAAKIADALTARNPARREFYRLRLKAFYDAYAPVTAKIDALRAKYAGTPVTATEPIFGDMANAIGLDMRNLRFQLAVMNDTEPGAHDLAAMQDDLKSGKVKLLIYNSQVSDTLTARLRTIAQTAKVPVVGVSETEPPGKNYQQWITDTLDAVDRALAGSGT
jgi:zinc/manganese transport system substrate-binding protein